MENRVPLSKSALWLVRVWSYLPVPSLYAYLIWDYFQTNRISDMSAASWLMSLPALFHPLMHVSKVRAEEVAHEFDSQTVHAYLRIGSITFLVSMAVILMTVSGQRDSSKVQWLAVVEVMAGISFIFAPATRVFLRWMAKPSPSTNVMSKTMKWLMGD